MATTLVSLVLIISFTVAPSSAATPRCFGRPATIVGTPANDRIVGTTGPDVIVGLGGSDSIGGRGGDDRICGNGDRDYISDQWGDSWIDGGGGRDLIDTAEGDDFVRGGPDDDSINSFGGGTSVFLGEGGNDEIYTDGGTNRLAGGIGNDSLTVWSSTFPAALIGGAGDDVLSSARGNDVLAGGSGDDHLFGASGDDLLRGGTGFDLAYFGNIDSSHAVNANLATGIATGFGTDALVRIEGLVAYGRGSDVLIGDGLRNVLFAGDGDDTLDGAGGIDQATFFATCVFWCPDDPPVVVDLSTGVATGQGNDTLIAIEDVEGSHAGDTLIGDAGPNRLTGRRGPDTLEGDAGDDVLAGGPGSDMGDGGTHVVGDVCFSVEAPTNCES